MAKYPFLDRDRVGVWGWSGGGTNTLNAMFRFPDVYKVGVSVAPVPDQRLYDTIYQERYMGLPQDNVEGYRVGSAINFAEGLQGKLLVDSRHRRRQRARAGHRETDQPADRAGQAVRFDDVPEPLAQHFRRAGYHAARLQADRATISCSTCHQVLANVDLGTGPFFQHLPQLGSPIKL